MQRVLVNAYSEAADRQNLEQRVQRAVLQKVIEAEATVPFYRWFYARHDLRPDRLESIAEFRERVPTVTKADIVHFQRTTGALNYDSRSRQLHLTSGTSGAGQEQHVRTQGDLAALGTGGAYEFLWAGLKPGDRVMLTMPYSQTMAGPYFQAACEAAGVVPINGFAATTEDRLAQLYRFECHGLVLTPSHLHRLTQVSQESGRRPSVDLASLHAIFLSGEPYGLEWAASMSHYWGARLYEGWGATQTLGVAMATCEAGSIKTGASGNLGRGVLHGLDHRCLIEILDPQTGRPVADGDTGEIVVTTFRTSGMPSIRFRMGDQVRRLADSTCDCGRPLSCYEAGTIGRLDDMIKVRGMNVWPSAVDEVVLSAAVADYTGRVFTDENGRESVELSVEPRAPVPDQAGFANELSAAVRKRIGVSVQVKLLEPRSLQEVQFKARRWRDDRVVLR
jgi:phenylacetate-CoA ligase